MSVIRENHISCLLRHQHGIGRQTAVGQSRVVDGSAVGGRHRDDLHVRTVFLRLISFVLHRPRLDLTRRKHAEHDRAKRVHTGGDEEDDLPRLAGLLWK